MKRILLFLLIFLFISCTSKKEKDNNGNKKPGNDTTVQIDPDGSALGWYNVENDLAAFLNIPDEIKEISGITFTSDDRLLAHGDEDADIFELDPETGAVMKRFSLGSLLVVTGDFEDITFVNDRFFLLQSNGKLYEFKEGMPGKFVDYKTYKTFLNSSNDAEGLCFDPETNSLLIACKGSPGKDYGKQKAVYSFSLESMTLDEKPRFLIDLKEVKENTEEDKFSPSGIARHPVTGTFFIIAAKGNTIIEVDKDGKVINQKLLPGNVHKQPEGIAFKKDGTMFISNEGRNKTARLVRYNMKVKK